MPRSQREALYSALSYPALSIKEQHAASDRFSSDYFEQAVHQANQLLLRYSYIFLSL